MFTQVITLSRITAWIEHRKNQDALRSPMAIYEMHLLAFRGGICLKRVIGH